MPRGTGELAQPTAIGSDQEDLTGVLVKTDEGQRRGWNSRPCAGCSRNEEQQRERMDPSLVAREIRSSGA